MKIVLTICSLLTLSLLCAHGQKTAEKQEDVHPAIQALITWAGSIKETGTAPEKSFFLPEDLIDPWGEPYRYQLVDGKPRLTSFGPDGRVSDDDLSSD